MLPSDPEDEFVEDPDEVEEDLVRSRTSIKKERIGNETALKDLVRDLLPLATAKWEALGLSEPMVDALTDARKIKSHAARHRHLRLLRSMLRDTDWGALRRRLDHVLGGYQISTLPEESTPALNWTEHLIVHGDAGLARFQHIYKKADRARLRQMIRNIQKLPNEKRPKARAQLASIVAREVGDGPGPEGEVEQE